MSKNGGRIANGGIKNQMAGLNPKLGPVFIYSSYRSSSTWLWDKFRQDVNACAYYEPFNPGLGSLRPDQILSIRPDTWRSHHPNNAAYMTEYAPLLGTDRGVALFPMGDQDGDRYIGNGGVEGPLDPDIQNYVSNLIESARSRGRVPVLSCTRLLGRAAGLSAAFGGYHILLIRNLFQQWCSYSGQLRFGNDYFFKVLYKSLDLFVKDEFISFLRGFFCDGELNDFNIWLKKENQDLIFCYFCAFHVYFIVKCRPHADIVIDVNRLARLGSNYQMEIADQVNVETGLQISLSDVRERIDYPAQPLKSLEDCKMLLRVMVNQLLVSEVRNDKDREFVELLLADLWDEYNRFVVATSGATEIIANEVAKTIEQADLVSETKALLDQANARLAEIQQDAAAQVQAAQTQAAAEVAEAKDAYAEASSNLDTALRALADQQQQVEEQARRHAATISAANNQIDAIQSALNLANERLVAAKWDHLVLARENGRLEGHLAAQVEANAARIADATVFRQEMLTRISDSERALAASQAEAFALRDELAIRKSDHKAALAEADARIAEFAGAHASASGENDRLNDEVDALSQQLAETILQHDQAAKQVAELMDAHIAASRENDRLNDEVDALSQQLAETILQHDQAAKQIAGLSSQRDEFADEAQQAVLHADALQSELRQIRDQISVQEACLQKGADLLSNRPRLFDEPPSLLGAVIKVLLGKPRLAALADHEKAVSEWQASTTLALDSERSELQEFSLSGPASGSDGQSILLTLAEMLHDRPITTMADLLAPHDREFIHVAYQAVLGRQPDPEGEAYYLERLRAGAHKLAIVKQLRRSTEGRNFIPSVAGLDRAIRRHAWTTLPVLGALLRANWSSEGNGATHRALRVLSNDLGRLRAQHDGIQAEHAALTTAVRELAERAFENGKEENNSFHQALRMFAEEMDRQGSRNLAMQAEQAALTAAVRELAQSKVANLVAAFSDLPADPYPELGPVNEAGTTATESGGVHEHESHLADPLSSALSAAVECWQD